MRGPFFGLLLILCLNSNALAARSRLVMGTLLEVEGAGADLVFAEAERLDRVLSVFKPDSEVSRLNAAAGSGPVAVSSDVWDILQASSQVWAASGGAFDPTYASAARGLGRLHLDPARRSVELPSGSRLDFGGIGKGFALDKAAALLRARGVRRAFLNFGGQLYALGSWPVSVAGSSRTLTDASVSGSDESEQPGHIVDPATGRAVHRAGSAFVILPSATLADGWSTALYVAGPKSLPPDFPGCALVIPLKGTEPGSFGHCEETR